MNESPVSIVLRDFDGGEEIEGFGVIDVQAPINVGEEILIWHDRGYGEPHSRSDFVVKRVRHYLRMMGDRQRAIQILELFVTAIKEPK